MKGLTLAILALLLSVIPAGAYVIENDPGGRIDSYEAKFSSLNASGERVVIDGACISACTMALGMVKNLCATPQGWLGFHSGARTNDGGGSFHYSRSATKQMRKHWPARAIAAIRHRGWDGYSEHPQLIFIPASELVRACPPT